MDGPTERINEVMEAYDMPEMQWIRPAKSTCTNPESEWLVARWQGIWNHLQENIHDAQQRLAKWHLPTKHPSKKLDHIKPRRFRDVGKNPPPPEVIDGEKFWVVESMAKSRLNRKAKRVEYLVFWQGYPPEEAWGHLCYGGVHLTRPCRFFHRYGDR
jgi:hypothetical protein